MNVTTSVPDADVELEELDELDELDEVEELDELEELVELETLDELDDPELAGSVLLPHAAMSTAPAANAAAKVTRLNMDQTPWSNYISPSSSIADGGCPVPESAKRDNVRPTIRSLLSNPAT